MSGFSDMGIARSATAVAILAIPTLRHHVPFPHTMRTLIAVALFLLFALPAHAASGPPWVEVRSPHFVILTDSNEKQGRKLAGQFERMRSLFQAALPQGNNNDANLPITVIALKDKKGFESLEPAASLAKGQLKLDGLFLRTQDRNYILLRLDAETAHPFAVVYHEYTHFILRKAEWLPLWLNEGLAEFYQNTDIEDKDVRLGQPSVDDILYLRQNRLLPLATLFAVDHNSPYYHDEQKGSVFYAESWALTHYIEITDFQNKTNRLQDYGKFLGKGEDPVTAAQHAFGDLGQLQKALQSYVSGANYQLFKMATAFTADESSFQAVPISLDDVNAVRADVLAHDDRRAEAQALLDTVLQDDPRNALAHEIMGTLAFRDHDLDAAKKWYGEAVQLDSQSYIAHYYYAVLSMNDTGKDDSIESSLRQAIKLEPGFAPPYDALARFYGMRHKNLDQARLLSTQAIQLEPTEMAFRINAAQTAMERQDIDSALAILNTARKIAKNDSDIAMLDARMQQIQNYKAQLERHNLEAATRNIATNKSRDASPTSVGDAEPQPYPSAPPSGPHHTVKGVLHSVKCTYPTVLTLALDQPGKPLILYSNNFYKVAFTLGNFTQTSDIDPCKDIDGMKAKIDYTDVTDSRVAGQIVAIELSK